MRTCTHAQNHARARSKCTTHTCALASVGIDVFPCNYINLHDLTALQMLCHYCCVVPCQIAFVSSRHCCMIFLACLLLLLDRCSYTCLMSRAAIWRRTSTTTRAASPPSRRTAKTQRYTPRLPCGEYAGSWLPYSLRVSLRSRGRRQGRGGRYFLLPWFPWVGTCRPNHWQDAFLHVPSVALLPEHAPPVPPSVAARVVV